MNAETLIAALAGQGHFLLFDRGRVTTLCEPSSTDTKVAEQVAAAQQALLAWRERVEFAAPGALLRAAADPCRHPLHRDRPACGDGSAAEFDAGVLVQHWPVREGWHNGDAASCLLALVVLLLSRWSGEALVGVDVARIERRAAPQPYFVARRHQCRARVDADQGFAALVAGLTSCLCDDASDASESCAGRFLFAYAACDDAEGLPADLAVWDGGVGSRQDYDIALHVLAIGHELRLRWVFNEAVFDRRTIEGLAAALAVLSDAVSADPTRAVESLPLLVAEPTPLAADPAQPGAWRRVHRRFEQQAATTPERPALQFAGRALSYRQLNERANRLARWLVARRGVAAGSIVAVCLDRSLDMVVAVLAILKTGAAYLPLDPSHPEGRIARVLADSGVTLALTQAAYRQTLLPASIDAVDVDDADVVAERERLSSENLDPCQSDAAPDALAYMIYTSGSTGEPKGVCIEQASFGFFVAAMLHRLAPQDSRRWLALITLTFDMALVDLFVPLCRGDLVVIAASSELADAPALQTLLHDNAIDALQATPTTWSMLVAAGWQGNDRLLAISGGEALDRTLADALLARCGQLWNGYGPTEITVYSLFKRVARDEGALDQLSIGCALPQVSHYILDAQRRALPAGAVGELFIGGPGLARGYHGKPELTARQFVERPFGAGSPRLYRTGDRVRLLPSGNIQYLGRLDGQIKLRGYRIEPGEIEYLLQRADGVEQAVVDVRLRQGSAVLVAFVKWRAGAAGTTHEGARRLRSVLKAGLPPYMVPDLFVSVDAFARTSSGKLDRKALQLPASDEAQGEQARNPVEAVLLSIWQTLFARVDIGVTDNFFALGGSSLLLGRLMKTIRAELGYQVGFGVLFEHDTVRQLGAYLQAQQLAPPTLPPIVDSHGDDALPLTPMQQHMWLTTQREPAAGSYNIPLFFDAHGALDGARLETALALLTQRFPALRASFFSAVDGEIRQRLLAQRPIRLRRVDLSSEVDEAQRQAALQAVIDDEATRPFDLQHEPLLRATAVTLLPTRHCLLLSLHHIVGDERSIALLMDEFARLYRDGTPRHADGDAYRTYLARRTTAGDAAKVQADLAHWEARLAGMPEVHRLPLDRPRGAVQSFNGALFEHDLDAGLAARSVEFARQLRATPFTVFHAALAALLSRLSGEKDIVIGTPVSDRHKGVGEQEVGCFLNVVPLRSDLSADPSLSALVQASRREVAAALQHDDVAFAELGRRLNLSNDTSHAAFFQIMLAQQTADYLHVHLDGLALRQFYPRRFAAKTDLIVNLCERDGATTLRWEYNADLWQADSIERIAAQFLVLLDAGLREPQRPLSRLPLTAAGERAPDCGLAGPAIDFGAFRFVHERFQAQAASTPHAIALRYREQALSYAELDRRADRLAHHLIAQRLGDAAVVAICLHRGIEMVVAVLAAMKAGLTYLPLDPTHPPQRLQQILADAGAALIITDRAALPTLPGDGVPLLCLEPSVDEDAWLALPADSPAAASSQDRNRDAYIIYTSGSTGVPKGVCISHAALGHFLSALALQLPERPRRWLAVITLAFDMSIVDLWLPLLRGDCVVIAGDEDIVDGRRLDTLIEAEQITALQATPSTWQLLLSAGWSGRADLLAISGGEALSEPLAKALLGRCEQLWNGYGPTEITVYSLLRRVHDVADVAEMLSLGGPLANTRHYVLDEHLASVPEGVAGQLYIGGPGLARQYFGQPALTAERFVEQYTDGDKAERLYRTGDLVCRIGAGRLQFLGRCDNQVKIRGYRIELGEIEQALLDEEGVRQAVVDVKSWGENAVLAAFVILDTAPADAETCMARLRKQLGQRLPRYMVPQILVNCAAFPRTPNGKVDRKALLRGVVREQTLVEPAGDTEQQLARLWAEILALDAVGATSSFFALGGQSILITKMLYLIRKTFGVELQVGWIYENPTVRGMAEKIDTAIALMRSEQAFDHVAGLNEVEL